MTNIVMMLWKVTWVVSMVTGCPPPLPDAYGRMSMTNTTQACYQSILHEKLFATEKEAKEFITNAPNDFTVSKFTLEKLDNPRR